MGQMLIFYAFAFLIALCSVMVVASRNPVASAMFLVADLFLLAGIYASIDAHFVAAIQVLVYAGAIVVLFMFVIMLLNLSPDSRDQLKIPAPEFFVLILTVVGFLVMGGLLATSQPGATMGQMTPEVIAQTGGNTVSVGMVLFTKYLWPFELASILILLAIIASVVIAKKDKSDARHIAAGRKGESQA